MKYTIIKRYRDAESGAEFYEVDVRTVKRYVENFEEEIGHNGYVILIGTKLKEFKDLFGHLMSASDDDVSQRDTDVPLSKQNTEIQSYKKIKASGCIESVAKRKKK